jgi:hypothetical protein
MQHATRKSKCVSLVDRQPKVSEELGVFAQCIVMCEAYYVRTGARVPTTPIEWRVESLHGKALLRVNCA